MLKTLPFFGSGLVEHTAAGDAGMMLRRLQEELAYCDTQACH